MGAGAPALQGAKAKISKAGAGAHAAAALGGQQEARALDPGAAVAAALMTKLPPVRFMRKLLLGLFGEGELFELHAGLIKCYTAVCD